MDKKYIDLDPPLTLIDEDKKLIREAIDRALQENVIDGKWNGAAIAIALDKEILTAGLPDAEKEEAYLAYQQEVNAVAKTYLKSVRDGEQSSPDMQKRAGVLMQAMSPKKVYVEDAERWAMEYSVGNVLRIITETEKFNPSIQPSLAFEFNSTVPQNEAAIKQAITSYKKAGAEFRFFPQTVDLSNEEMVKKYSLDTQAGVSDAISGLLSKLETGQALDDRDNYTAHMMHLGLERSLAWAELIGDTETASVLSGVITAHYTPKRQDPAVSAGIVQNLIRGGYNYTQYVNIVPDLGGKDALREANAAKSVSVKRDDRIDLGGARLAIAGMIPQGKQLVHSPEGAYADYKAAEKASVTDINIAAKTLDSDVNIEEQYTQWSAERRAARAQHKAVKKDAPQRTNNETPPVPQRIPSQKENRPEAAEKPNEYSEKQALNKIMTSSNKLITVPYEVLGAEKSDRVRVKATNMPGKYEEGPANPERKTGTKVMDVVFVLPLLYYGTDAGVKAIKNKTRRNNMASDSEAIIRQKLTSYWEENGIALDEVSDHFFPGQFSAEHKTVHKSEKRNAALLDQLGDVFADALDAYFPNATKAQRQEVMQTMLEQVKYRSYASVGTKHHNPHFTFYFSEAAALQKEGNLALKSMESMYRKVFNGINQKKNATAEQAVQVMSDFINSEIGVKFDELFTIEYQQQHGKLTAVMTLNPEVPLETLRQFNDKITELRHENDGRGSTPELLKERINNAKEANKNSYLDRKNKEVQKTGHITPETLQEVKIDIPFDIDIKVAVAHIDSADFPMHASHHGASPTQIIERV